jgi:serine/threonine-protein kinase HipA
MAHERFLHLGVGQHGRLATLDNAMSAKEAFSLSGAEAARIVAEVWSEVREWRVRFESHGVASEDIEKVSTAIRHLDDVASSELRKRLP